MPLAELFAGSRQGTILGVQLRIISGITTVILSGLTMALNNISSERTALLTFNVDGKEYQLRLQLTDEAFELRNIDGSPRSRRDPARDFRATPVSA